jgi:biotin carboxylase
VNTRILLLGNHRHTVTVVRSLGRAGLKVILGLDESNVIARYSRYCSETWPHPRVEDNEEEFAVALESFAHSREDVRFVFPIGEAMLAFMTRNAARFPNFKIVAPAMSTVFNCLEKQRSYAIAEEVGIPVPTWRPAGSIESLRKAAREVGYPCVVKPNRSHHFFFGRKAIVCRNASEVERNFQSWPKGNVSLIVQRYIDSERPNCHFRAIDGTLLEYFEHIVVRTDRIDETGFEIDGLSVAPTPILRRYCSALIRRLDYNGVGCVQFLTDRRTNEAWFLEINPRLDATCALPYAAGINFPLYAVEPLLTGRKPAGVSTISYPAGVRIHYLMGDLQGLFHGLVDGSVSNRSALHWMYQLGKSALAAQVQLTFTWTDPSPTIRLYADLLKAFRRRTGKRIGPVDKTPIKDEKSNQWRRVS